MIRIVLWEINNYMLNYLMLIKGIKIVGIVSNLYRGKMDGVCVLSKEELHKIEFDYIIVSNDNFEQAIGMWGNKVINADVFGISGFVLSDYLELYSRNITIISDDCWGAYTYNYLGMRFNSPFILCSMSSEDYLTMLENLWGFLDAELECEKDYPECPYGRLSYCDDNVMIKFNHYDDFMQAKNKWEKRKLRINKNNIFVKMTIQSYDDAIRFSRLPFENKIGFVNENYGVNDVNFMKIWREKSIRTMPGINHNFKSFILRTVDKNYHWLIRPVSPLKLMLGQEGGICEYELETLRKFQEKES